MRLINEKAEYARGGLQKYQVGSGVVPLINVWRYVAGRDWGLSGS